MLLLLDVALFHHTVFMGLCHQCLLPKVRMLSGVRNILASLFAREEFFNIAISTDELLNGRCTIMLLNVFHFKTGKIWFAALPCIAVRWFPWKQSYRDSSFPLTTVQKSKFSSLLHQRKCEAGGTIPRFNPQSRSLLPVSLGLSLRFSGR